MEEFIEFLKSEGLIAFRTDDFEYDITESFRGYCVPLFDRSDPTRPIVRVKYGGRLIPLHYKRDVFTGSIPFFYTLIDCDYIIVNKI